MTKWEQGFPGICRDCGKSIKKGQPIRYGKKHPYHAQCQPIPSDKPKIETG